MSLDRIDRSDLPVVPGEIVGWRAWTVVTRREPRLRSLFFETIWPTDEYLIAGTGDRGLLCKVDAHGICAARDRDHLFTLGYNSDRPDTGVTAIGQVGLAGLIVPGQRGYRAEKARPVTIELPYAAWELVKPLQRAYRVPVSLSNVLVN